MIPQIAPMAARAAHGSIEEFARAIMTTDTYPKWSSRTVTHQGRSCTVVGCAKGAGMIHPNMATMISVITTDASLTPSEIDGYLRAAVERSFHRISIDGDTSTNDSVFALASGAAGAFPPDAIGQAFKEVARDLALLIVRDGEGYERGIHVRVTGAPSDADALSVAKSIASSLLVRCAVTGGDPNWGRILAAAGRAGVTLNVNALTLNVGGIALFGNGAPAETPLAEREAAFRKSMVEVHLDLGSGEGAEEFISCGLTKAYVELNADYTT
jgi:glutamate N-acetyltransferase/amino-acid N-acetyltransferase